MNSMKVLALLLSIIVLIGSTWAEIPIEENTNKAEANLNNPSAAAFNQNAAVATQAIRAKHQPNHDGQHSAIPMRNKSSKDESRLLEDNKLQTGLSIANLIINILDAMDIFGEVTLCKDTDGSGTSFETIKVLRMIYFFTSFFNPAEREGQCGDLCAALCNHQLCVPDYSTIDPDLCTCINDAVSNCGANTRCDALSEMCVCNDGFVGDPLVSCNLPTAPPTVAPTAAPNAAPTVAPNASPTVAPTDAPNAAPTVAPTDAPNAAPTVAPIGKGESFGVIISSDPQYHWYDSVYPAGLTDEAQKKANAERQIRQQYESMTKLAKDRKGSNDLFQVKGVLINGDLTRFGDQNGDFDKFKELVDTLATSDPVLKVYPALGNHDYANNVNDCINNWCASTMVKYMVDWLNDPQQDALDKAPYPKEKGSSAFYGSLSYSFNIDKVHFIQLQFYPSYTTSWTNPNQIGGYYDYVIAKSLDWLEHDLAIARNRGDIIIVSLHDYGDNFSAGDERTQFDKAIKDYAVSAVFAGHIHKDCGKVFDIGGSIPFFRSGSASYQDYLVVDINVSTKKMDVWKNQDTTLNGEYKKGPTTWTVDLVDDVPVSPLPVPPRNKVGFVLFFNQGGYVAKFQLDYNIGGELIQEKTGDMTSSINGKYYTIPEGATDIRMRAWEYTGLVWEPEREVFNELYDSPPIKCYKIWGTTLDPKYDNNYCRF